MERLCRGNSSPDGGFALLSTGCAGRVRTSAGLCFCPVVLSLNGRVKPDAVLVNGKAEHHPEGAYYLEWREGAKRVRISVGKNSADAHARRLRKEAELNARNNGVAVIAEDGENQPARSIADAVASYLAEIKISRSAATYSGSSFLSNS
jgi:integrase/recombinase XerD